tara:strand:- start:40723 stop:41235 length:513 start_codon:yes stop_codon:yes gene_type:complete
MAKSARERKQEQLEREKERLKSMPDLTYPFLALPFFEYAHEHANWSAIEILADMANVSLPDFDNDDDPHSATGQIEPLDPELYERHRGSIGKAEILFMSLLDAATELSRVINDYKREQLDLAISNLKARTPETPEAQTEAFDEMVKLTKLREQLDRNFRRTFPQVEVKEM